MEEEYFMWLSGAEERIEKINLALQLEDTCSNMIFLNINDQFSCKIISTKQIIVPNDGDKCFILWNVVIKGGDEEICADLRTQINETVQTLTQISIQYILYLDQLNVILDKLLEFMEYHYEIEGNYSFEDTMNDDRMFNIYIYIYLYSYSRRSKGDNKRSNTERDSRGSRDFKSFSTS